MFTSYFRSISLIFSCLISAQIIFSQEEENLKELFVEAESYFLFEEYKEALPLYQKILRVESQNYNVLYKIGICYLNDIYLKDKAIAYLEKAAEHVNGRFKQNSFREKMAPLEVHYYLGRAYHINDRLDDAINSYNKFRKLADPEIFDFNIVDEDIKACEAAKKMKVAPVYFLPKNIGEPVNTRFEEINPVISGDGKTLAFTRRMQFYDAVFITMKNEDGSWKEPQNLTSDFAVDGNTYTTGISYFGDELFLYRSDDYDGNIYTSKKTPNKWTAIEKLNDNINTKYWESHASPSADGQHLYFSSNRAGGYGGLDIYRSKKGTNGDWGVAVNLGPVINTPSNDDTPFLGNEGYSLFFSSQNHGTMGDYEIYISSLRSDGTWDKPKNMGYPVNSTGTNSFYSPLNVNAFGLYSMYDPETTLGMRDIYLVEVYNEMIPRSFTLSGSLKSSGDEAIEYETLKILLLDKISNEIFSTSKAAKSGEFSVDAQQGEYELVVEGTGIEKYKKDINLKVDQSEAQVVLPAISLIPAVSTPAPVASVLPVPEKQQILVKNDFFAVEDSSIIPIELIIPRGSDVSIEIFLSDSLIKKEELESVRRRFTYFYKPLPGDNRLLFTATDTKGNSSSIEVNITYHQPEIEPPLEIIKEELEGPETGMQAAFLAAKPSPKLMAFIRNLHIEDFDNYNNLYEHLVANAADGGYSKDDVDKLYSVFFTQKDLIDFDNELSKTGIQTTEQWLQARDSSLIPLQYINVLLEQELIGSDKLTKSLLEVLMATEPTGMGIYKRLVNFTQMDSLPVEDELMDLSIEQGWDKFFNSYGIDAEEILKLSATTLDLDYFYQSMLIATENELKEYLNNLNFKDEGIKTAIDLTQHLFMAEPGQDYTIAQLIQALELIRVNKDYYLMRFKEILTLEASGALKSQLFQAEIHEENVKTYEGLINYLTNQAEFRDYSRESVYDLLLSLIGIKDVNEFAEKLTSYDYANINKAIADTSLQHFSNPFELVQYLIAVSSKFDFADTDINNLLIRMLLEKGIDERLSGDYDDRISKFWRERKFITTIILVNILLLVLILLFVLRRKSNS